MAPRYNGHHFRALVNASLEGIRQVEAEINRLNVFPVPDSDTGTNLRMTLEAVAQTLNDGDLSTSAHEMAERASRAALMAARGNSGVMLAQLFRSIARTLRGRELFSGEEFSLALQQASDMLYRAVGDPVEGTILTVLRRAAEAAAAGPTEDLREVLDRAASAANVAVEESTAMLPVLQEAGVVDAGGYGLYVIFRGMRDYLNGDPNVAAD